MILERPRIVEEEVDRILEIALGGSDGSPEDGPEEEACCYICNKPKEGACHECHKPICFRLTCAQGIIDLDIGKSYHRCKPCDMHFCKQ